MSNAVLTADLNVLQATAVEIQYLNGDLNIIAKLDDEPNDVGGLSSDQLKAKFDEAGNVIKDYINNTLIPAILASDSTEAAREAAEKKRVANEKSRQSAETARASAETERASAETARQTAESKRQTAEAGRVAAEKKRVTAETARQTAETARQNAETAREDKETGYVADAEAWATGTRNGVPVAHNDPAYENNARYFKDQASAVVGGEFVSFGRAQALTPQQLAQAQQNIGVTWACNPNLLQNWYFPLPVNQRDVSGTISTAGYFLDGWKLVSGAVTIGTDGITLNGTMTQVLEHAPAGTVTASVLTPEGVGKVVPVYDGAAKTFTITAVGKKLLAAKLELGSVQTLAHQDSSGAWVLNEIPDYAEQLAACQRQLIPLSSYQCPAARLGTNEILFFVPLPVTMRTLPAINQNGFQVLSKTGEAQTGFTFSVSSLRSNGVIINASKTGHGMTDAVLNAGTLSLLSAEL